MKFVAIIWILMGVIVSSAVVNAHRNRECNVEYKKNEDCTKRRSYSRCYNWWNPLNLIFRPYTIFRRLENSDVVMQCECVEPSWMRCAEKGKRKCQATATVEPATTTTSAMTCPPATTPTSAVSTLSTTETPDVATTPGNTTLEMSTTSTEVTTTMTEPTVATTDETTEISVTTDEVTEETTETRPTRPAENVTLSKPT